MANIKTPSQYASGKETFNDNLVGFQVVDGSSQMTNTSFAIDRIIPEKDSKTFQTQPFSSFLTLDIISQEDVEVQSTSTKTVGTPPDKIKFYDAKNDGSKSLFGSLSSRLNVAVQNIITKFPAALYVDIDSPIKSTNFSAEAIVYDERINSTQFQVQINLLFNPFEILLSEPKSNVAPETTNNIRNFYSSYTKYVLEISGVTHNILSYTEPDTTNKITLEVYGNCFSGLTGYTDSYLIRPNNGIVEEFFSNLDELEIILLDRETIPKYQAKFRVPRDINKGASTELITEVITWPTAKDNWNIQIIGIDFDYYLEQLSSIGDDIDNYKSNLIVRFLTAPQLFEFDTEEQKAESIFQIYGQSFDKVKKFIDNIAFMRNVTYDKINNVPDLLLKNLAVTLGINTVNLFNEKSLQDSLYTRTDTQYIGLNLGKNLIESEYEFYRRLLVNLAYLYKSKGTRRAIEFFLKFIGAPEPMIRLDEYIYKVDSPLPKSTYEADIRSAIQGNYMSYTAVYTGETIDPGDVYGPIEVPDEETGPLPIVVVSKYVVVPSSGSTTLTRDEYPVDEDTGLPRGLQSPDGSIFFQLGAGWYKKTIDHRSHDILDTANSVLTGRTKIIKTMSKPFTYGEDYFDYYRTLPGLDYGYDLTGEIDNVKTEIIVTEEESRYSLNRKNINVFLSADRAIDYDIYTKSRNLLLTFGTLTPQTGVTFAEFLSNSIDDIIKNSSVIRYKRYYQSLDAVYNDYLNSTGFTPYNYIKINEFIDRMSPYWTEIIDQFVPATTLWLGGNLIENGTYNRSKFFYRKPCTPIEFAETLYPDFESIIEEDLETVLGGGSVKGVDMAVANLRGLFTFTGLTYILYIDINGHQYTGQTEPITNELFTGFTPTADCTSLVSGTTYIPLICEYKNWIIPNIPLIKDIWVSGIENLVTTINGETSTTGVSIKVEFFTDIDGTEKVKFIIMNEECIEGDDVDFYFEPLYGAPKTDCDLRVEISTPQTRFIGELDNCQLKSDVYITILNDDGFVTGIEETGTTYNDWPLNFYVTSGSSCSGTTQCYLCEDGYTWYPYDSDTCYRISTTGATPPATPINLVSVGLDQYSRFGTKVFDTGYDIDGTGVISTVLVGTHLWENIDYDAADGPMNRCALWTNIGSQPLNTWVGFAECLTGTTETKTYYVGTGGDNFYRIVLDGETIVNSFLQGGIPLEEMYRYWHLYPVEIGAGTHVIEVYGLNLHFQAGFGCEIYDNTLEEIMSATTYEELSVVFTTSGKTTATIVQDLEGNYMTSGYTCPSGYTYSECSGTCVEYVFCESSALTGATAQVCTNCDFIELNVDPIVKTATGCTYMISGMSETDIYDIIIADAANCEQKLRLEGLQPKIENIDGVSGYTIHPKVQYKTTHNFGLKKGSVVYREINEVQLIVWENLYEALVNGDIEEVLIDNVEVGDVIISLTPKNSSQISITDIQYALENNASFDFTFNYNRVTVTNKECSSSLKKSIINDEFIVLPTTKLLVYSNMNESLESVPFQFMYKYPEDLFIKSDITPEVPCCEYPINFFETSDRIMNQYGFLIEVTGVSLNYCDGGIYYRIDYEDAPSEHELEEDLTPYQESSDKVLVFNGELTGDTRIIVSYEKEEFKCLDMKLQQYFTNTICSDIPTVEDLERTPCGLPDCEAVECEFDAEFVENELVECLATTTFIVQYNTIEGPCPNGHRCDCATFKLTANNVDLGTVYLSNTSGSTDQKNYPPGEDGETYSPNSNFNRYNEIMMSPEQAQAISEAAIDGIVDFSLVCVPSGAPECYWPSGCHEDVTWIKMVRNDEIIYEGCPDGNFISMNPCTGQIYE